MAVGNRRWSVPPRRFGASVVLTTIGVFTICGGIGKNDLTVGALGVTIVAVAVGIYVLSALSSRTLAFVIGTGHVVSASPPPSTNTYGRCTLQLLVTARNLVGIPVKVRDPKVPLAKWPDAGTDLPIMVALGSSRKVRVLWDEVPQHGTPQAAAAAKAATVRVPSPPPADDDDDFTRPGFDDIDTTDIYGDDGADPEVLDETATFYETVDEPVGNNLDDADPVSIRTDVDPRDRGERPRPRPHRAAPADPPPVVIVPPPRAGSAWRDLPDVDLSGVDDEAVPEPEAGPDDLSGLGVTETNGKRTIELDVSDPSVVRWSDRPENAGAGDDPDDHDAEPESYPPTGGPGSRGYDRRTEPPADAPESGLPRRTPSPRPRMGVNEPMRDGVRKPAPPSEPEAVVGVDFGTEPPLETPYVIPPLDDPLLVSAALTDSMPTVPIRFHQARVVSPGVSAAPDSDDLLFDQAADGASVAEAYMAATPPPGTAPGTVGRIRSVAATLFVTDLSRSIIFYRDTLGFIEADAGRGSAVLVSGDAKIVLRRVGMAPVDRRLVQLLLEVPDVNAAYEDLRARSVPFIHRPRKIGQYEQQTLWAAALRDPDGHGIAITQWRHA